MKELSPILAALFFLLYAIISIAIGVIASRRESEDDFMIASRHVHGLQIIATMSAGWFDGVTLSIYLAYVYQFGLAALSLFIGIGFGFLLFRYFAARIKRTADTLQVYSMPEYFLHSLGKRNAILFSVFLIVQFFGYLIINFILSGKVLSHLFPAIPYPLAVGVGAAIILTYLLLAGFKAVVRTDFYQLIIMVTMTVMSAAFLFRSTHVLSNDLGLADMGFGNVLGFFIISGFGVMVAPDIWQRVFAAQDEPTLRRGFLYTAIFLPLLALVITVVGIATKHRLPSIPAEDALVKAFMTLLPPGITEFAMVLLYAVSLSSSDTVTFVVASIVTRDLKNYTQTFNEESARRITRVVMIAFVLAAMLIAVRFQHIIHLALSLGSLNLALFPVVIGTMYWKLHHGAVFWSLICVLMTVCGLSLSKSLTPETAALSLPVAAVSLAVFHLLARRFGRTHY